MNAAAKVLKLFGTAKFLVSFFLLATFICQFAALAGVVGMAQGPANAPRCVGYGGCNDGDDGGELQSHGVGLGLRQFAQHQFVQCLYLAAAFFNVFLDVHAYIIYIIKEIAEGVEQEVWLGVVFNGLGVGDDAYA